MNGVEVKETYPTDFEKIYPLLQDFNSPYSLDDWKKIFYYQWDGTQDYVGFHLEHNDNVVGFMGLIFSCRYKDNHRYQFCNITSLIVKEEYRSATLLLIRKLKKIENTIFTGLRPILESYRLLEKLGFSSYECHYKIIPTINCILGGSGKIKVYEQPILQEKLDAENMRIIKDHENLACKHVLLELNGDLCLLIYRINKQNYVGINVKKVSLLYVSDINVFNANIHNILRYFKKEFGLFSALYLDSRFIRKSKTVFSIQREINPPRICSGLHNNIVIDELYSEAVLL